MFDFHMSDVLALSRLHIADHFPAALLDLASHDLWRLLDGPTLFYIEGRETAPLFVTVLLHGNEHTGWQAVQSVLRQAAASGLPRSLLLFVANIAAARANVRTLPPQCDFNRTWPGTLMPMSQEAQLMRDVVAEVGSRAPFASIDIHNNTGLNPHYACLNRLDGRSLHLARLFSRTVVYFEKPAGVQSAALAGLCPAVTVECGRAGGPEGVTHAAEFIRAALALSHFPDAPVPGGDLDLLQTFAIVKVPDEATFTFDGKPADFMFRADLDHLNFSELEPGTPWAKRDPSCQFRLEIVQGTETQTPASYFRYAGDEIQLAQKAVPAMLTMDPQAIRLDCLGYLMHRIGRDGRRLDEC